MTDKTNGQLTTAPPVPAPVSHDTSELSLMLDSDRFAQAYRACKMLAASDLVPSHYKKPENVFVAMVMADRLKLDPMMVMQNTYVVHGRFAMEAKMAIALINRSGKFKAPLQFTVSGEGDDRKCVAWAEEKFSGVKLEAEVSIRMAKADGWYEKSGSKWKTLPDLMLRYRSAMFFGRLYCPGELLGMMSVDEAEDADASELALDKGHQVTKRFGIEIPGESHPLELDESTRGTDGHQGIIDQEDRTSGVPAEGTHRPVKAGRTARGNSGGSDPVA